MTPYNAAPANPTSDTSADEVWFPLRVTSIPVTGQYVFQEVWMLSNGVNADRIGGRSNSANDPAYAIDGSTFAVTAAGSPVQVLGRRAPGAGGVRWELKGFGGNSSGSGGWILSVPSGNGLISGTMSYGPFRAVVEASALRFVLSGTAGQFAYSINTNSFVFHYTGNVIVSGACSVGLATYTGDENTTPPVLNTLYYGYAITGSGPISFSVPFNVLGLTRPLVVAPACSIAGAIFHNDNFSASWSG